MTVLFCVYIHNPAFPSPSYTSRSVHFMSLSHDLNIRSIFPPLSPFSTEVLVTRITLVSLRIRSCTCTVTDYIWLGIFLTHNSIYFNNLKTCITSCVTFCPSHVIPVSPLPLLLVLRSCIDILLGWEVLGGLGLALGLRSRGFLLAFL